MVEKSCATPDHLLEPVMARRVAAGPVDRMMTTPTMQQWLPFCETAG
jgi:hypothetical protein